MLTRYILCTDSNVEVTDTMIDQAIRAQGSQIAWMDPDLDGAWVKADDVAALEREAQQWEALAQLNGADAAKLERKLARCVEFIQKVLNDGDIQGSNRGLAADVLLEAKEA